MSSIWKDIDRMNRAYRKQQYLNAIQECYNTADKANKNIADYISFVESVHKNCELIKFDYDEYYDSQMTPLIIKEYQPILFPNKKKIRKKNHCIKENKLLEKIDKKRKEKRIQREKIFLKEWEEIVKQYEIDEKSNRDKYEKYKKDEIKRNNEINKHIIEAKKKYEENDYEEIRKILDEYMKSSRLNTLKTMKTFSIDVNGKNKCWQFNFEYLQPDDLVPEYKKLTYIKSKNEYKKTPFSQREQNYFYQSYIFNFSLAFASMISYAFLDKIEQIIINCFVCGIDNVTGKNEKKCIFTSMFDSKDLNYDNLQHIDSKAFFDSVNSKYSNPLIALKKVIPYSNSETDPFEYIDKEIDGFEFEKYGKKILEKNGFENIYVTQASGDYGADIIAHKDNIKYAIQCKKYSSKVGVKAVQEVMASREIYKCHVGAILTNNYFTPNAIKLADENKIILWDKVVLTKMLEKMNNVDKINKNINLNISDENEIEYYNQTDNDNYEFKDNTIDEFNTKKEKNNVESEIELYGLEEVEKEYVYRGDYEPYNFEDSEEEKLDEDDYYYEDK